MKLVFVRHLPTQWNIEGRLQGRHDEPVLEPDEVTQAQIGSNCLALVEHWPFDRVVTSTLQRTHQTAIHHGFDQAEQDPLLDELDFGRFEGRPRAELLAELEPAWTDDPRDLVLGEPVLELQRRIRTFVETHRRLNTVLAFSHGGWCRGLLSIERHGDLRAMNQTHIPNGKVLVAQF